MKYQIRKEIRKPGRAADQKVHALLKGVSITQQKARLRDYAIQVCTMYKKTKLGEQLSQIKCQQK